ncbi:MAG: hypothetical protein R3B90_02425 [Planctomycetaceae bacterium]
MEKPIDGLFLLAERNEEINKWLSQNPVVLGLIFLAIGAAVGGWGLYELSTGVAYSKRGKATTGNTAKTLAIVRIVAGAGCILFGLFKIVLG